MKSKLFNSENDNAFPMRDSNEEDGKWKNNDEDRGNGNIFHSSKVIRILAGN